MSTNQLTTAQRAALAAYVATNLSQFPHTPDGAYAVADALNQVDASNTSVWWTATPTNAIFDTITWAAYTPNDAPDGTALFTNRVLTAQTKQMNLQNMLVGRDFIDASLVTFRAGLRDAVIQLPTGTGGAMVAPGGASGVTTLTACKRPTLATKCEKLFSAGASTTGTVTADILTFEGTLSPTAVQQAMGW